MILSLISSVAFIALAATTRASNAIFVNAFPSGQKESNVNGWSPGKYPNPLSNPTLCRIASSINAEKSESDSDGSTFESSSTTERPLFFCDPNAILEDSVSTHIQEIQKSISLTIHTKPKAIKLGLNRDEHKSRRLRSPESFTRETKVDNSSEESYGKGFVNLITDANIFLNGFPEKKHDKNDWSIKHLDITSELEVMITSRRMSEAEYDDCSLEDANELDINVAVAIADKINLQGIVRVGSSFSHEKEEDMINDAAQYFAKYLYDSWDVGSTICRETGILIFLSVENRVCFIATGSRVSGVLPWWRLIQVIDDVKPHLRHGEYGHAIIRAINDISDFIKSGPPTLSERFNVFSGRYGVVILFAICTIIFAFIGEYRERWNRWHISEVISKLSAKEVKEARSLQREYRCTSCPICLEKFKVKGTGFCFNSKGDDSSENELHGSDGRPLKLLRCGHVFDETCWRAWVSTGEGNPFVCPICRKYVGCKPFRETSDISPQTSYQRLPEVQTEYLYARPDDNIYGAFVDSPSISQNTQNSNETQSADDNTFDTFADPSSISQNTQDSNETQSDERLDLLQFTYSLDESSESDATLQTV